jgi:hypothetical protein
MTRFTRSLQLWWIRYDNTTNWKRDSGSRLGTRREREVNHAIDICLDLLAPLSWNAIPAPNQHTERVSLIFLFLICPPGKPQITNMTKIGQTIYCITYVCLYLLFCYSPYILLYIVCLFYIDIMIISCLWQESLGIIDLQWPFLFARATSNETILPSIGDNEAHSNINTM